MQAKSILLAIGKLALRIAGVAAALWLAVDVVGMSARTYLYSTIGTDEHSLSVVGSRSMAGRYALLQIANGSNRSNVIAEAREWDDILRMVEDAEAHRSPTWHVVGTFAESDVANPSRLTISAGPSIRFAIVDDGVCLRYEVATSDFAEFRAAAKRAKRNFEDDGANNGLTPLTPTWGSAARNVNEAVIASLPKGQGPNCS